jgi:type 1 glutamine amidotransferase
MHRYLTSIYFLWLFVALSCIEEPVTGRVDHQATGIAIPSLKGKKVLFVYGGWEGHRPDACRDIYVPWLKEQGAQVVVSNSLDTYADSTIMQGFDLIVQTWTLGEINPRQLGGLLKAVERGTGFAGWHGGIIDAFRGALDYHLMTGGQFLAHPGGLVPHTVNIKDSNDPIMQGINDFTIHTEQYYMLVDPNVKVLATTTFNGEHLPWINGRTMPVIWTNTYGKGRVFVNAIGHQIEDHSIPEFRTTMQRGMRWASK